MSLDDIVKALATYSTISEGDKSEYSEFGESNESIGHVNEHA